MALVSIWVGVRGSAGDAGNWGVFDAVLGDVYNADWIGGNSRFWVDAAPNLQEIDCRKAVEVFIAARRTQGVRSFYDGAKVQPRCTLSAG